MQRKRTLFLMVTSLGACSRPSFLPTRLLWGLSRLGRAPEGVLFANRLSVFFLRKQ
jgi:hypothetical protein